MGSPREFAKSMLEDAYQQEAVNLCIKDGKNYYFLSEAEQAEYDKRGKEVILTFLAEGGIL